MKLFELKHTAQPLPTVIEPNVDFVVKALSSVRANIIGNADPLDVLNDALADFNVSFQYTKAPDSRVRRHDEIGIVRAETEASGRIMIDMEADLREVFTNDSLWDEFLTVLTEVVGHELIHREQFKDIKAGRDTFSQPPQTGDKRADYKAYLASKHELMAYAYQSVMELRNAGFKKSAIATLLDNLDNENPGIHHSAMMSRYEEFFGLGSTEFAKFILLMKSYLKELEI